MSLERALLAGTDGSTPSSKGLLQGPPESYMLPGAGGTAEHRGCAPRISGVGHRINLKSFLGFPGERQ